MDKARDEARAGAKEGLVVVSLEQTRGRGRLGRTWVTPTGGLAVSVLLEVPADRSYEISMLGAVAIQATIEQYGICNSAIKWPNDVLINSRKIAGILVESRSDNRNTGQYVLGMGINLNVATMILGKTSFEPTSLHLETGRTIDIRDFLILLLIEADRFYDHVKSGKSLFYRWKSKLETLGKRVTVSTPGGKVTGLAQDVTPQGHLIIRHADGNTYEVLAGDVNPEVRQ